MTRHRNRRRLAVLVALLAATACTQSGAGESSQQATTQAQPASTPSTAPPATLIGGQQVSLEEVERIEATVRKYFDAFFSADFKGLAAHSTGELKVLAGWQRVLHGGSEGFGALSPAAASVDDLEVVSVTGNTATVQIKGQLDETAGVITGNRGDEKLLSTNINGAVSLVRGATWQVADFHRGGRWAREQIYTRVRGQRAGQGVVVKVVGVDLRPKGTVLMLELRNTTGLKAGASGAVIRDPSGRRFYIAQGRDLVVVEVRGRSKATAGLFYLNTLRPTIRRFNIQVDVNLGCNPVCKLSSSLDIPVQLLR
jgi:hypothetical protein